MSFSDSFFTYPYTGVLLTVEISNTEQETFEVYDFLHRLIKKMMCLFQGLDQINSL